MDKTIAIIHWEDAAIHGSNQYNESKIDFGLMVGFACGIIVKEDKKSVTLAMDYFPKQRDDEENSYRVLSTYPKSGIRNIKRVEMVTMLNVRKQKP